MFFTILLLLWIIFLGLVFIESKLIKSEKTSQLTQTYFPIRLGIILLSIIFVIIYSWNLSTNINIQNIIMTSLMVVTVLISLLVTPKKFTSQKTKIFNNWLLFRNIIAIFNTITMLVHFIIFVLLA